jgi:tryptophanyl-tRNA synthetase
MSKSAESPKGLIMALDDPDAIRRKFRRAVTDPGSSVRYDVEHKAGVSNLLTILAAATGRAPDDVAEGYDQYGPLKDDTADAVIELLRPIRERYAELAADQALAEAVLKLGADKAREVASATLARAQDAVGLLPAG